jgi:hypothetical protein
LLEKALAVLDELYGRSPIFNVEQFAVSAALEQATQISTCEDLLTHYYGTSRRFIHVQAARFLPDFSAATLEDRLKNAEFPAIGFPSKTLLDKVIARLLGAVKDWHPDYRFAYLAYRSAFAYRTKDPEYANVWAAIALQMLQFLHQHQPSQFSLTQAQQDFRRFQSSPITTLDWLEPTVKHNWVKFLQ